MNVWIDFFTEIPVEITSPLQDREVTETETTSFKCQLSKPNMKVKWLYDGKEVPRHPRFIKSTHEFDQILTIKSSELGDAGQYQLIADNASTKAVLRVKGD